MMEDIEWNLSDDLVWMILVMFKVYLYLLWWWILCLIFCYEFFCVVDIVIEFDVLVNSVSFYLCVFVEVGLIEEVFDKVCDWWDWVWIGWKGVFNFGGLENFVVDEVFGVVVVLVFVEDY